MAGQQIRVSYIGGTIKASEAERFKRLLFRITRGKAFTRFEEIHYSPADLLKGMKPYPEKLSFIVMFEEGSYLKDRVSKVC